MRSRVHVIVSIMVVIAGVGLFFIVERNHPGFLSDGGPPPKDISEYVHDPDGKFQRTIPGNVGNFWNQRWTPYLLGGSAVLIVLGVIYCARELLQNKPNPDRPKQPWEEGYVPPD